MSKIVACLQEEIQPASNRYLTGAVFCGRLRESLSSLSPTPDHSRSAALSSLSAVTSYSHSESHARWFRYSLLAYRPKELTMLISLTKIWTNRSRDSANLYTQGCVAWEELRAAGEDFSAYHIGRLSQMSRSRCVQQFLFHNGHLHGHAGPAVVITFRVCWLLIFCVSSFYLTLARLLWLFPTVWWIFSPFSLCRALPQSCSLFRALCSSLHLLSFLGVPCDPADPHWWWFGEALALDYTIYLFKKQKQT